MPFLDITERQREPGIEPNRMLDDHWRKAMSLEGYRGHMPTVATPNRPDQTLNVSMPLQINGVERLGEPAVDRCEEVAGIGGLALGVPQPGEAG